MAWYTKLLPAFISEKRNVRLTLKDPSNWPDEYQLSINNKAINVTPDSSMKFGAVVACVNLYCQLASLPWKVYREDGDARYTDKSHSQYKLLKYQPHPWVSTVTFRKALITHYLLWGDAYAVIERDNTGTPVQYHLQKPWEFHPHVVTYTSGPMKGQKDLWYKDYTGGKLYHYLDVIHISDLTKDGLTGLSRIQLNKKTIGLGLSGIEYGSELYEKGVYPGGILKAKGQFSPVAMDNLTGSFADEYAGVKKSGSIIGLEDGVDFLPWKPAIPMADAEFIKGRVQSIRDVGLLFNINPHFLGVEGNSSYNSQEHAYRELVDFCLRPTAVLIENEFDRKVFLDDEDYYNRIELKGLLRGNFAAITERAVKYVAAGIWNKDEARAMDEQNPIPGGLGKEYMTQLSQATLDNIISGEQFKDLSGEEIKRALDAINKNRKNGNGIKTNTTLIN